MIKTVTNILGISKLPTINSSYLTSNWKIQTLRIQKIYPLSSVLEAFNKAEDATLPVDERINAILKMNAGMPSQARQIVFLYYFDLDPKRMINQIIDEVSTNLKKYPEDVFLRLLAVGVKYNDTYSIYLLAKTILEGNHDSDIPYELLGTSEFADVVAKNKASQAASLAEDSRQSNVSIGIKLAERSAFEHDHGPSYELLQRYYRIQGMIPEFVSITRKFQPEKVDEITSDWKYRLVSISRVDRHKLLADIIKEIRLFIKIDIFREEDLLILLDSVSGGSQFPSLRITKNLMLEKLIQLVLIDIFHTPSACYQIGIEFERDTLYFKRSIELLEIAAAAGYIPAINKLVTLISLGSLNEYDKYHPTGRQLEPDEEKLERLNKQYAYETFYCDKIEWEDATKLGIDKYSYELTKSPRDRGAVVSLRLDHPMGIDKICGYLGVELIFNNSEKIKKWKNQLALYALQHDKFSDVRLIRIFERHLDRTEYSIRYNLLSRLESSQDARVLQRAKELGVIDFDLDYKLPAVSLPSSDEIEEINTMLFKDRKIKIVQS